MPAESREKLGKLLVRCINRNQLLILEKISENSSKTFSSIVNALSNDLAIPLSTLKLNAKVLRGFDLIDFSRGSTVKLTCFGDLVFSILSQSGVTARTVGCKPTSTGSIPVSGIRFLGGIKNDR